MSHDRLQCALALRAWHRTPLARRSTLAQLARQLSVARSTLAMMDRLGCAKIIRRLTERARIARTTTRFATNVHSKIFCARTIRALRQPAKGKRADARKARRLALSKKSID